MLLPSVHKLLSWYTDLAWLEWNGETIAMTLTSILCGDTASPPRLKCNDDTTV